MSDYTTKITPPHYQIRGKMPKISDLYDVSKYNSLIQNINASNVSDEEKEFLRLAATRHIVVNFAKAAEYYAGSDIEMQDLMEEQALVIIDSDSAIANGYMRFNKAMSDIIDKRRKEERAYET